MLSQGQRSVPVPSGLSRRPPFLRDIVRHGDPARTQRACIPGSHKQTQSSVLLPLITTFCYLDVDPPFSFSFAPAAIFSFFLLGEAEKTRGDGGEGGRWGPLHRDGVGGCALPRRRMGAQVLELLKGLLSVPLPPSPRVRVLFPIEASSSPLIS